MSLSESLFICLFQTPLPFPFLLPLCISWTLSSRFVPYVVIQCVTPSPSSLLIHPSVFLTFSFASCTLTKKKHFLWFSASPSHSPISVSPFTSLPLMLLFFLGLKWMVFLRKSAADCCRARGLECHRSRLIYPPLLSSCYAWSLNFPFLLFFPCFFSQIPPLILPDAPPLLTVLIFLWSRLFLLEYDTCSVHATGLISSLWAYSHTQKYVVLDGLTSPDVMHSVHRHTWKHFWGYICIHCSFFSTVALAPCHISLACTPYSI